MVRRLTKQAYLKKSQDRFYQFKICTWIALGKTTPQILILLKERLNIDTTKQNIDHNYRYSRRWAPTIIYLRKRFLNNISRIPISQKCYRLWLLNEAAEEALTKKKRKTAHGVDIEEKKINLIPQIIREARNEVEGRNDTNQPRILNIIYGHREGNRHNALGLCNTADRR